MTKNTASESFLECRDRLMAIHKWDRKKATLAARYYRGIDSLEELRSQIQFNDVQDIIYMR